MFSNSGHRLSSEQQAAALSELAITNDRNRRIVAQYSHRAHPWDVSAGFGYARRRFISDSQSVLAAANGVSDMLNIGAYAAYRRLLMRRLAANASLGVESVDRRVTRPSSRRLRKSAPDMIFNAVVQGIIRHV